MNGSLQPSVSSHPEMLQGGASAPSDQSTGSPGPLDPASSYLDHPASPIQYQTAPIQVLMQNGTRQYSSDSSTSVGSTASHNSLHTAAVAHDAAKRVAEQSDPEHEDVWEDSDDSASDISEDADSGEDKMDLPAYRAATAQYRKSRKALLLSGLSSMASSPSAESLINNTSSAPFLQSGESNDSLAGSHGQHTYDSYIEPEEESAENDVMGRRSHDMSYAALARSSHLFDSRSPSATPEIETDDGTVGSLMSDQVSTPDRNSMPPDPTSADTHSYRSVVTPRASISQFDDLTNGPVSDQSQEHSLPLDQSDMSMEHYELAPPFDATTPSILSRGTSYLRSNPILATLQGDPSRVKQRQETAIPDATSVLDRTPFSLWDYLQEEVLATDFDSTQEMKWERVTNFISIPFWMEKIILFGFVVCLDSFLYTFTILPLRFGFATWRWITNTATWMCGGEKRYLHSSHKCDILKMLLIILSCIILSHITDASKMYHSVRGQDVVKLSVIFNVLEIADRLCCSFGQDLLDSLFSRTTLARRKNGRQPYLRPFGFFCLSLCYVLAHTLVLFYQLVTLNVAINSYDNALLTLLLSNQFVEIKSSVFKKFEKENVFQMTCADIVERFQLTLMLSAIGLRNLIELSGGSLEGGGASPLPASFTVFPSLSLLETILTPVCIVLASECIVDWLKHAFITKFNHIRPAVYGRFMDVLCRDLVVGGPSTSREKSRKHTFVDQSPIVSRRLGFAALPLACLLVRLILQIISMIGDTSHIDECAVPLARSIAETGWVGTVARKFGAVDIDNEWVRAVDLFVRGSAWALTTAIAWIFLVAIKLLLGTNLVSFASHRYATMHEREVEENLNAKDRPPIGTDKEERIYDKRLGVFLDKSEDDAVQILVDGSHVSSGLAEKKIPRADVLKSVAASNAPKKDSSLMDVSRYTMVRSRIW